jgi:hypothetical protein
MTTVSTGAEYFPPVMGIAAGALAVEEELVDEHEARSGRSVSR